MDDICDSLRSNLLDANVDMDVTPFDNSKTMKEGVSQTYKGFDGYAPMVAYIGTEGFMSNIELSEGKTALPGEYTRIPEKNPGGITPYDRQTAADPNGFRQ